MKTWFNDSKIKFDITITLSKLLAFYTVTLAFIIDYKFETKGSVFMYTLPFALVLIGVKQYLDKKKFDKKIDNAINIDE